MKVKVIGIPQQKQNIPQIAPFSNPYSMPLPQKMEYGGARPNQGFDRNGNKIQTIDTGWDWLKSSSGTGMQPGPYSQIGKTLPEANQAGPNVINAEKKEMVMGDFTGDGQPVLMGVDGPPHGKYGKGGKDVEVPNGSYIFPDTKSLTIKDPDVLSMFGTTKPQTSASLAKRYDLQKYKAVIDDPNADALDKKTNQYNYINGVNALNKLASVTESLKQSKGLPNEHDKMPISKYGGLRSFQKGGGTNSDVPWADQIPDDPHSIADNNGYNLPNILINGTRLGIRNNPQPTGPHMFPTNISDPAYVPPNPDYGAGFMDRTETPQLPSSTTEGGGDNEGPGNKGKGFNYNRDIINPDTARNLLLGLRAMSYPNYSPTRMQAHAAIPQTAFLSPERALAAIQETGSQAALQNGQGPIGRANNSAVWGQIGREGANVVGNYDERNVGIANKANELAANIYNQTQEKQQMYNQKYSEDVNNSLKDRFGFNSQMSNEFLKGLYEDRARQQTAYNYNYINPYYSFDSQGWIHPKSKAESAAVRSIANSHPGSEGSSGYMSPEQTEDYIKKYGVISEEANKLRSRMAMYAMRGPYTSIRSNPLTGMPLSETQRGYGDQVQSPGMGQQYPVSEDDGYIQKYGGKKKTRIKILSTP